MEVQGLQPGMGMKELVLFFRIAAAHQLPPLVQCLTLSPGGEEQQEGPGWVCLFLLLGEGGLPWEVSS